MRLIRFLPLLVFAIGLLVTQQLWQYARQDVMQELRASFDLLAREAAVRVEQRMATYEQVLRGANGLFAASASVERDEFRDYVNTLHLEKNYPGIQSLRFTPLVRLADKDRHIASIRKQGFPDYTIWPEGRRDFYAPVAYAEPFDARNGNVFGYDMYSDLDAPRGGDSVPGLRHAAMVQARDLGAATSTGKVELVFENNADAQVGFMMFLPVYTNGALTDTLAARRTSITGWISAVFRMDDLMNEILGAHAVNCDIEIYDGNDVSDRALMHDSGNHSAGRVALFRTVQSLVVDGRHWTMVIHSLPGFEARLDREKPQIVANAAIGVSLLLALLAWILVRGRKRIVQTAEYLAKNEATLQEMFGNMSSGVAMYQASPDGSDFTVVAINPAAERIENIKREDVIGQNVAKILPGITGMGLLDVFRRVWKTGVAEKCPAAYYQDSRMGGWRENYVYKLHSGQIVAIYDDVTERKQAEDKANYLAHYDTLTSLPNRTLITDRIRQALAKARRDNTRMALMFVDLDFFKPINDEFGHAIGDLLLQATAQRLQDCMRESDTAARTGGDEFIVLLPTIEVDIDAMVVAEKICQVLGQPFELAGYCLSISCSVGVAIYPEHGSDGEQLLKHADSAMYHAKQSGRNNVKMFRAGMQKAS
ncbi:MAG TPA: CHASE domain-containing protein [Gallionella sp.]|nr:CHASE domain-containing protein [Gallionella sp.]